MKKLDDLFDDFTKMSPTAQIDHIRKVRNSRHIERPKAAVKRAKKEKAKSVQSRTKVDKLLATMSDEQKEAFLASLLGSNGESE